MKIEGKRPLYPIFQYDTPDDPADALYA